MGIYHFNVYLLVPTVSFIYSKKMDNFHDFVDVKYCAHFLQDPAFCSSTVTDTVLSARFPGFLSDAWTVMTDAEVPAGAPREVCRVWGTELPLGGAAGLVGDSPFLGLLSWRPLRAATRARLAGPCSPGRPSGVAGVAPHLALREPGHHGEPPARCPAQRLELTSDLTCLFLGVTTV